MWYSSFRMQRWEYRVFVVSRGTGVADDQLSEVDYISEIRELPRVMRQKTYEFRGGFYELAAILTASGEDGWEVCGTLSRPEDDLIILKRPMSPLFYDARPPESDIAQPPALPASEHR